VLLPGDAGYDEERADGLRRAPIDGLRPWDTGAKPPDFLGGDAQPHLVRAA
jgi:hypothetical protein